MPLVPLLWAMFELLCSRVPRFTELTVLPLYASGHLIRFGLGGFENPLPLFGGKAAEQVEEILHAQNIPLAPLPAHDLTNEAISTAVAIGNFIRAGRGGQGQPKIERDTLQKLEAELGVLTDQLKEKSNEHMERHESATGPLLHQVKSVHRTGGTPTRPPITRQNKPHSRRCLETVQVDDLIGDRVPWVWVLICCLLWFWLLFGQSNTGGNDCVGVLYATL